jgi:hypothetical protein
MTLVFAENHWTKGQHANRVAYPTDISVTTLK